MASNLGRFAGGLNHILLQRRWHVVSCKKGEARLLNSGEIVGFAAAGEHRFQHRIKLKQVLVEAPCFSKGTNNSFLKWVLALGLFIRR